MKTIKINAKKITNVFFAEKSLRDAGFALIGVVAAIGPSPYVHVHLEDRETKDPTPLIMTHVDPCLIEISSNKTVGVSGAPEALANNSDKHSITVSKKDPVTGSIAPGSEQLQIIADRAIPVSLTQRQLTNGVATFAIGPTLVAGPLVLRVVDQNGVLTPGAILLRFV